MTKDLPSKSSLPALRGTAMHQVLELCLKRQQNPGTFLDYVFNIEDQDITFDADLVKWTAEALEWVREYRKEHKRSTLIAEAKLRAGAVMDEELTDEIWGTADVLVYSKDELLVFDLKGGYVDVEVVDNYQLILYAVGAVAHFEDAMDIPPIETIRLVIHQPRTGGAKQMVVQRETLDEWATFLTKAAKEATQKAAPLRASDEACKWCPAVGSCPAAHDRATALARVTDWPEVAKTITDEQLTALLGRASFIRRFLDAAENWALQRLLSGERVAGYKIVQNKKHRRWKDEKLAELFLTKKLGPGCFKRTLITPAQAEKQLSKEAIAELTEIPVGDPTLAPEDDPRPALPPAPLKVIEGGLDKKPGKR